MAQTTALNSVFLSYASADNVFAHRIHDDLRRSRLDVWGFEENGQIGINFIEEFSNELRNRRYFCLLDSMHARQSTYVRQECEIAMACVAKDPSFTIAPCLIQSKNPAMV